MPDLPENCDVLIVGAGPTGLTLACTLAARGVPHTLVDRLAEGANTSRAVAVHARTLEVLEELEVAARLSAAGVVVPRFVLRDRDQVLATLAFDHLPTRYPHVLMVPQQVTEGILLQRLRELGGSVQRPWALERVATHPDAVAATLRDEGGASRTVHARWLVGCDGMHSTVREQAGIGFAGGAYEQSFVLADVRLTWALPRDEVTLFLAPAGLMVVAPLPHGHHRIVATLDDAPAHPSRDDVQRLLDERGPIGVPASIDEMAWSSRFHVHHRLAARYRKGRVLLAGDAAHVHSPAGGQGMNTGIQDAILLGEALATAAAGGGEQALDAYEQRRRPVAERVVRFTDRLTRLATLRAPLARAMRNSGIRLLGRSHTFRRRLAFSLAGLRNR